MKGNREKLCYTVPRMEAMGFRIENGYAVSGSTQTFNDVNITFG